MHMVRGVTEAEKIHRIGCRAPKLVVEPIINVRTQQRPAVTRREHDVDQQQDVTMSSQHVRYRQRHDSGCVLASVPRQREAGG